MNTKEIRYDRKSRDYAMYLDGEPVGFARSYHEAEVTLDQLVFELLSERSAIEVEPTEVTRGEPTLSYRIDPENLSDLEHVYYECSECGVELVPPQSEASFCQACQDAYDNPPPQLPDTPALCEWCEDSPAVSSSTRAWRLCATCRAEAQSWSASVPCGNCGGPHHIQQCPELMVALAGYTLDAALRVGRNLVEDRIHNRARLVNFLWSQSPNHLASLATCEALYMRGIQRDASLQAIIARWRKMMAQEDAPGGDCSTHGPYSGEDCPNAARPTTVHSHSPCEWHSEGRFRLN